MADEDGDLVDYEEEAETLPENGGAEENKTEMKKGSYAGIHSSSFRDFLLKPELLNAISDCGFEHPSEDVICQAKSGMGKTAVFVLTVLQLLEPQPGVVDTLVLTHTRELAYQITKEFERFSKYLPDVKGKVQCIYGGVPIANHRQMLKDEAPCIVVGTPGRILALVKEGALKADQCKRFVLDECDQMLESLDMRRDVQAIFRATRKEKQVLMFSATMSQAIRPVCRKFTQGAAEIFVDNESKLTLHGLQQYFVKLKEDQKNRKLNDLLDALEFNQVVIFVNGVRRCKELSKLLIECNFPSEAMYGGMKQEDRIERYNKFKEYKSRIMVSTDIFGRGVDFERVNIVINYDVPPSADQYLHRVGRSGRFGTKGLAITFVSSEEDQKTMDAVQGRFEVSVPELPDEIDVTSYMSA